MNQLDAFSEIISYVRERGPEEPRVVRALKILEKRHQILRARHELRVATIADDIHDEPLTVTWAQVRSIYDGDICVACLRIKDERNAFCAPCFRLITGPTRKAFTGHSFHAAFCRGLRELGCKPQQMTGAAEGMVGWAHDHMAVRKGRVPGLSSLNYATNGNPATGAIAAVRVSSRNAPIITSDIADRSSRNSQPGAIE